MFLVAACVDGFDAAFVAVDADLGGGETDDGAEGGVEVLGVAVVAGCEAGVEGVDVAEVGEGDGPVGAGDVSEGREEVGVDEEVVERECEEGGEEEEGGWGEGE